MCFNVKPGALAASNHGQTVKARTRVVRVAEYVEYSGPKALLTLTRVATLMCDPTTHTHPSSKQVELVTTHEYSEYSLSGVGTAFSLGGAYASALGAVPYTTTW